MAEYNNEEAAVDLGVSNDDLEAIDDMLISLLSSNPDLTPDQLTPEMIAQFMAKGGTDLH